MSRDPLKVLYCSFDVIPEPTGTSARATGLLRALTAFNVDALTAKSPDHPHIERFHGARLMRVPVGSGDLLVRAQAFERAVRRQLESDEYHLVHFTDPYGGYAVCELKEQDNFKLVYEVVGFPSIEVKYTHPHLESDRRFMAKLRRQELFCLMNADAVIVGCEVTARMVQGLGVSRERIMVQPTPVDLAQYAGAGIPRPDRVPMRVIYAGSQISWQGLATLLSAVSIASRSCELRLAIMGPQHPSWRLQLEEMIKYRKLSEIVELRDPVPPEDMVKALASADVGVAPFERSERTTAQGAPVSKIAHYLAAGRPVVASDLPMIRELVDESCALFHAPGDDEGLARSLVALAHDPARRNALGAEAARRAQSRLSSETARVNVLKLYAGLLAELGEQIEIPEAVVPDVSSDAPTSIGAFKPDDATVTHFELGAADAMTDPFARLEGHKTGQTEAFTTPQAPPSAPNLFVSESLLKGESGSSDGPVGTNPAAPARDSAPPAEEAGAGS
ncbi:MAG: glycosyltransferase, partial [Myxococcales bacterium]